MRSAFAAFLRGFVLPFGATTGTRIFFDGTTGTISFYNSAGDIVAQLAPGEWFIGTPSGERITLDPSGGLRIRNAADVLVGVIDQEGYTLRDSATGAVLAEFHPDHLTLRDPAGTFDIVASTSSANTHPDPRYGSTPEADPGTTFVAPAVSTFGTGDDLELVHAAAWEAGSGAPTGATFTPPGGYTERYDEVEEAAPGGNLHVSAATRQPAVGSAATLTNSSADWQSGLSTHVLIRGGGGTSPSFRSVSKAFFSTAAAQFDVSLSKPTGTATGDDLIAIIAMGNAVGSVPVGWTTPEGWRFLGAKFLIRGSGATQSTLAVGVWWKPITDGASEPASYSITINFGAGDKVLHAAIVAIQNVDTSPGGPNILIGPSPVKRLLAESVLTAASVTVASFSDIPAGPYRHLQLEFYGMSDTGADAVRNLQLRFNGDSGANYHSQTLRDGVAAQVLSGTGMRVGELNGASAGHMAAGVIDILEYASGFDHKIVLSHTHSEQTGNVVLFVGSGQWNSAAAINALALLTDSGATQFNVGSIARLYGW